ncbi:MAG: hypothetical protein PHP50_14445 [Lachnospiraceae bacterium]|nr:hypothetical protein [Lachnospiraceae bacterium]
MIRTIRYFTQTVEQMILIVLGFALFYTVIFEGNIGSADSYAITFGMMATIMGFAMLLGSQAGVARSTLPLVGSMGSTRREVFWGLQYMNISIAVQLLVTIVLGMVIMDSSLWEKIKSNLGLLLFLTIAAGTVGEGLTAALIKFSGKANKVIFVFVVLICTVFGVSVSWIIQGNLQLADGPLATIFAFVLSSGYLVMALAIGLYILGAVLVYLAVRKYEVFQ